MDYISKEDAIDCVLNQYCASSDETEEALGAAIEEIKKRPAADVVERKRGYWINHRNDNGHNIADCSLCGETLQWFDDEATPKYCCMCGAELEEADERLHQQRSII